MSDSSPKFTWISLGVEGGLNESNLSSFLLAPYASTEFICLDAGTIYTGLRIAAENGCFYDIPMQNHPDSTLEGVVLEFHIKAYFISHCYLDHIHGLTSISPNDTTKPIFALAATIDDIRDSIFNWTCWPNMANEGKQPCIGRYQYQRLATAEQTPIINSSMFVEAFPLAHNLATESAAFLIESAGYYVLYMGDTGPDEMEKRTTTVDLWQRIVPLVQNKKLRMISLEASYIDSQPDDELYGHLTPKWILNMFNKLALMVDKNNPEQALVGLNVVITHIKPNVLSTQAETTQQVIERQIKKHNNLGIHFIFAKQGERLEF